MLRKLVPASLCLLVGLMAVANTGCFPVTGPSLGLLSIPIPVSPYFQEMAEDEFRVDERYSRVPILGPLSAGGPAVALDPPSDEEVMYAFERARPQQGGVPFLREKQINNVKDHQRKDCGLCGSSTIYSFDWPSPIAPCTLQMHRLLLREDDCRLACTAHASR